MALFENFPYTNLHELNLDWLIQDMKELEQKLQDGPVVSVNGLTGEVILYRQPNIQFPDVNDSTVTKWEMFRYLNGHIYGIQFDNNGNVYALRDFVRTKLLTWDDIPADAGVISVNGLYGVVHLSGTDIPYMGGETETVYDKLSDLDDDLTSAQADINDLTVTMGTIDNAIKRGIAYLESTDTATNNIPAGRYVFWKNYAYISTSAISVGDTLSSTNLSAVATGGFINALKNELQTEIDTLNSKIAKQTVTTGVTNVYAIKNDLLALVWFIDKSIPSVSSNGWQTLFTLPSDCRPSLDTEFTLCVSASSAEALEGRVKTTGEVNVYAFTSVSGKPVCGQVMFFI